MLEEIPRWLEVLGMLGGLLGSGWLGGWLVLRSQMRKANAEASLTESEAEAAERQVDARVAEGDASAVDKLMASMARLSERVSTLEEELAQERSERLALALELEECKQKAGLL